MLVQPNSVFTEIEISAPAEKVWSVLTDWPKLSEWSSSFVGISADQLAEGLSFKVFFKNPLHTDLLEFERVCTVYREGRQFGWSGELLSQGLKDNHIFTVVPLSEGRTLFKQEDGIHGKHSKLLNLISKSHLKSIYEKFNVQLKNRVETLYPSL